jgi:hypothetical protein
MDGYNRSFTKVDPGRVYSLLQLMHRIDVVADVAKTYVLLT